MEDTAAAPLSLGVMQSSIYSDDARVCESLANNGTLSTDGADMQQSGNCSELPSDMRFNSAKVISICGYGALFLASSVANITVLSILLRRYRRIQSRVTLLLIHLAIADLLVTFLMMPLEIGWAATVMWTAGDVLCRIFAFFKIFGLFLSGNILICISLDRFYAIVRPLAASKATRNMKYFLAAAWIMAAVSASPQLYIFHVATHPQFPWYTQCVDFGSYPSPAWQKAYMLFDAALLFFIPLAVIIVTYTVILVTINNNRRMCASGGQSKNGDATSNGAAASSSANHPGELRRSGAGVLNRARARTLKMTVVMVCVFIFCWTPYYVISMWFLIDKESFKKLDSRLQNCLFIFACTNAVADPFVYGFFNLRKPKSNRNNRTMANGTPGTPSVNTAGVIPNRTMRRNTTFLSEGEDVSVQLKSHPDNSNGAMLGPASTITMTTGT